jgi:hypothetical protein
MTMPPAASRPPLGSWPRTYLVVCALAITVMVLLHWFTTHWNVPVGKP